MQHSTDEALSLFREGQRLARWLGSNFEPPLSGEAGCRSRPDEGPGAQAKSPLRPDLNKVGRNIRTFHEAGGGCQFCPSMAVSRLLGP